MEKLKGVSISKWMQNNQPDDGLIYKNGVAEQAMFGRDILAPMFIGREYYESEDGKYIRDSEREEPKALVVGTHRSKSVLLPVIGLNAFSGNLQLIWRNNFHVQPLSIISSLPLDIDISGITYLGEDVNEIYCNGFPSGTVKPKYITGTFGFTIDCSSTYEVFTIALIARRYFERTMNIKTVHTS